MYTLRAFSCLRCTLKLLKTKFFQKPGILVDQFVWFKNKFNLYLKNVTPKQSIIIILLKKVI